MHPLGDNVYHIETYGGFKALTEVYFAFTKTFITDELKISWYESVHSRAFG